MAAMAGLRTPMMPDTLTDRLAEALEEAVNKDRADYIDAHYAWFCAWQDYARAVLQKWREAQPGRCVACKGYGYVCDIHENCQASLCRGDSAGPAYPRICPTCGGSGKAESDE